MKISIMRSRENLWEYLAIISMILECSSIYFNTVQGTTISSNFVLIIGFLPLTISGLLYLVLHKVSRIKLFKVVVWYLSFFILYCLTLGKAELVNFLMKFGAIFPCIGIYVLYLIESAGFRRFAIRYVRIVSVIAGISLMLWLLGPISGILKPTSTIAYIWGNIATNASSYFNFQFETQLEQTVFGVWRNTAFFTEAPKYGLILSIAYIFNYLFLRNKKIMILLLVTIISTFSFTSIIAVVLIHFIEYSMNVGRDVLSRKAKVRTIIWPIMIAVVLILIYSLMYNKLDTSSGVGRVGDFVVCFMVGMHHPIFGWGFLDNEYLNSVLHSSRLANGVGNTMGLSNSISQIFVDGGIYLISFYLIPLISIILWGKKNSIKIFSIGIIFLYFIITTYFAYSGVMFFILSFGYGILIYKNFNKLQENFGDLKGLTNGK